jgi:hypothetical protein
MSPIQRGELENIVNAQIAAIVVLSRHLKWIKSSKGSIYFWSADCGRFGSLLCICAVPLELQEMPIQRTAETPIR